MFSLHICIIYLGTFNQPSNPLGGAFSTNSVSTNGKGLTINCTTDFVLNHDSISSTMACLSTKTWTTLRATPCLRKLTLELPIFSYSRITGGVIMTPPAKNIPAWCSLLQLCRHGSHCVKGIPFNFRWLGRYNFLGVILITFWLHFWVYRQGGDEIWKCFLVNLWRRAFSSLL